MWRTFSNLWKPERGSRGTKGSRSSVRLTAEALESRYAPATIQWTGAAGDGSWDNPGNWQGGQIPSFDDVAQFDGDITPVVSLNEATADVQGLTVRDNAHVTATNSNIFAFEDINLTLGGWLTMDGGIALATGINIGALGGGRLTLTNAAQATVIEDVIAGGANTSAGLLEVLSGSQIYSGFIGVARDLGSSGSVIAAGLGSTVQVGGFTYTSPQGFEYEGLHTLGGNGTIDVSDQALLVTTNLVTGDRNSAKGSIHVASGGQIDVTDALGLGSETGSMGTLLIESGGKVTAGFAGVGIDTGSSGSITVRDAGSTLDVAGSVYSIDGQMYEGLYVGLGGTGTANAENGGSLSSSRTTVARNTGSSGTAVATGTGSTLDLGSLSGGSAGTSSITSSSGGTVELAGLIADQVTAVGLNYQLQVAANVFAAVQMGNPLTFSATGMPGWMQFDAATRTFSGTPGAGDLATSTVTLRGQAADGSAAATTIKVEVVEAPQEFTNPTFTGGTGQDITQTQAYIAHGTTTLDANGANVVLTKTLNDFDTVVTVNAADVSLHDNDDITLGDTTLSGTLVVDATGAIVVADPSLTLNGNVSLIAGQGVTFQGGQFDTGSGHQVAVHALGGPAVVPVGSTVTVGGGSTLSVSQGFGLPAGQRGLIVQGTVGGTGIVSGETTVASGGSLSPAGGAVGTVQVAGTLAVQEGGHITVDVNGTGTGQADQVNVVGTVQIGAIDWVITPGAGYTPEIGDSFVVVSNDGTDAVVGAPPAGQSFVSNGVRYQVNFAGGDGNDVVLTVVSTNAPTDPISAVVHRMYIDILGRTVDEGGLQFWSSLINQGIISRALLSYALWISPEHRGIQVDQIYQSLFGRLPDAAGRQAAVNAFQFGITEEVLIAVLTSSAEYLNSTQGVNGGFIGKVYRDVNDLADNAPIPSDVAQLNALPAPAAVATLFALQRQRLNTVDDIYQTIFHRNADSGGRLFWANLMALGVTRTDIAVALLASQEYFDQSQA